MSQSHLSPSELKELYNSKLKYELTGLEAIRIKVRNLFIGTGGSVLSLLGGFAGMGSDEGFLATYFPLLLFVGGVLTAILGYNAYQSSKEYKQSYKDEVVRKVAEAINPNWVYKGDQHITEADYKHSELYRRSYDRYKGDDLVYGSVEDTDFCSSELHTEYKTESTDSDGSTRTTWHTIFKGLFFYADFHKHFKGKTFVSADRLEGFFGKWARKVQRLVGPAKLVNLENVDFEKHFVVHSTNQIEARYIITPAMMEAMLRLKQIHGLEIKYSFVGTRVYCALSFSKKLFEPKIFQTGVNWKDVSKIYNTFMLNITLINELNLNTRIWTKE